MAPSQPVGTGAEAAETGSWLTFEAINKPTATNDSQKPACSSAHGSSALTTTAATSRIIGHGQRRPDACSTVTVASIHTVRCDGTPQPENKAYASAASTPPQRAACCAGSEVATNVPAPTRLSKYPSARSCV